MFFQIFLTIGLAGIALLDCYVPRNWALLTCVPYMFITNFLQFQVQEDILRATSSVLTINENLFLLRLRMSILTISTILFRDRLPLYMLFLAILDTGFHWKTPTLNFDFLKELTDESKPVREQSIRLVEKSQRVTRKFFNMASILINNAGSCIISLSYILFLTSVKHFISFLEYIMSLFDRCLDKLETIP